MTTPNPQELFSPFLPSTFNLPEEKDRQQDYLGSKLSQFSDVINDKKIGTYLQAAENFNGESWFFITPKTIRTGYQTIAYIPSFVPQTITLTSNPQYPIVDVNPEFVITLAYGSASKRCSATGAGDGDYFSFFSQGDARIQFTMSDKKIVITTNGTTAAYSGFIVIHYLRNGI